MRAPRTGQRDRARLPPRPPAPADDIVDIRQPSVTSGPADDLKEQLFSTLHGRLEFEGSSVHAVTLPGRLWPVVEYMAEMAAASTAMDLCSRKDQAVIVGGTDCVIDGRKKARPTGAAV